MISQPRREHNPMFPMLTKLTHYDAGRVLFSACYLLHAGFLFGLFFDPEDEGDMFLRNVG
jgi:hypothetical protein